MLTGGGLNLGLNWGGNSGLLNLGGLNGLDLWLLSLDLSGSWGSSLSNGSSWGSLNWGNSNWGNSSLGDGSSWGGSDLRGSSLDGLGSFSDGGSLGGNS